MVVSNARGGRRRVIRLSQELPDGVDLRRDVQRRGVAAVGEVDALRARSALGHRMRHVGQQQVGIGAAQQQQRHAQAVIALPAFVVAGVVAELADDGRVVVRGDAAVGQAPYRGLGHAAPLFVALPAVGLVGGAQPGFEFGHGIERRRLAGVGQDAVDRGLRQRGADVVHHQVRDAVAQRGGGRVHASGAAHGRADPAQARQAQPVGQRARQPGVEVQAVFGDGVRAPLRQAAADGIGTDDAIVVGQRLRQLVEVAPGAGQAVPHDDGRRVGRAPFHIMQFPALAAQVARSRRMTGGLCGRLGHGLLPDVPGCCVLIRLTIDLRQARPQCVRRPAAGWIKNM